MPVWAPKKLLQTFEDLFNALPTAAALLEKSVQQTCALPRHPAVQVLYFIIQFIFIFFLASETGYKLHLQFNVPQALLVLEIIIMAVFG